MSAPRTPDGGLPLDEDQAAAITWQEMWIAADCECVRADSTRRTTFGMIAETTCPRARAHGQRIVTAQARLMRVFDKIRTLIDRCSNDPEIKGRLREIAAEEKRARDDAFADGDEARE